MRLAKWQPLKVIGFFTPPAFWTNLGVVNLGSLYLRQLEWHTPRQISLLLHDGHELAAVYDFGNLTSGEVVRHFRYRRVRVAFMRLRQCSLLSGFFRSVLCPRDIDVDSESMTVTVDAFSLGHWPPGFGLYAQAEPSTQMLFCVRELNAEVALEPALRLPPNAPVWDEDDKSDEI